MRSRGPIGRALPAALALLAILLLCVVAPEANAQWAREDLHSAAADDWIQLPLFTEYLPLAGDSGTFVSSHAAAAPNLEARVAAHNDEPYSGANLWGELMPCWLAGMVVGGAVGYAAYRGAFCEVEPCDGDENPFCPLEPYAFVVAGSGAGSMVGGLVGYIRTRR